MRANLGLGVRYLCYTARFIAFGTGVGQAASGLKNPILTTFFTDRSSIRPASSPPIFGDLTARFAMNAFHVDISSAGFRG